MRRRTLDERYQRTNINFFKLVRNSKLSLDSAFLLSYYRMIASFFGKPDFDWSDKKILLELAISKKVLHRMREELKSKNFMDYTTNNSAHVNTAYKMYDIVMADIKEAHENPYGPKFSGSQTAPLKSQTGTTGCPNGHHSINKSNVKEMSKVRCSNKTHQKDTFIPVDKNQMRKDVENFLKESINA